ncbi:MAG: Caspase domain-containing protein, partial [Cyanobacteria bacterium J06606_4]
VIRSLAELLDVDTRQSYVANQNRTDFPAADTVEEAYHMRLQMELANVGIERTIRNSQNPEQIAILEKIQTCEAGSW